MYNFPYHDCVDVMRPGAAAASSGSGSSRGAGGQTRAGCLTSMLGPGDQGEERRLKGSRSSNLVLFIFIICLAGINKCSKEIPKLPRLINSPLFHALRGGGLW
jgi:hypothetical protein